MKVHSFVFVFWMWKITSIYTYDGQRVYNEVAAASNVTNRVLYLLASPVNPAPPVVPMFNPRPVPVRKWRRSTSTTTTTTLAPLPAPASYVNKGFVATGPPQPVTYPNIGPPQVNYSNNVVTQTHVPPNPSQFHFVIGNPAASATVTVTMNSQNTTVHHAVAVPAIQHFTVPPVVSVPVVQQEQVSPVSKDTPIPNPALSPHNPAPISIVVPTKVPMKVAGAAKTKWDMNPPEYKVITSGEIPPDAQQSPDKGMNAAQARAYNYYLPMLIQLFRDSMLTQGRNGYPTMELMGQKYLGIPIPNTPDTSRIQTSPEHIQYQNHETSLIPPVLPSFFSANPQIYLPQKPPQQSPIEPQSIPRRTSGPVEAYTAGIEANQPQDSIVPPIMYHRSPIMGFFPGMAYGGYINFSMPIMSNQGNTLPAPYPTRAELSTSRRYSNDHSSKRRHKSRWRDNSASPDKHQHDKK